jgi:hypothetical protein
LKFPKFYFVRSLTKSAPTGKFAFLACAAKINSFIPLWVG